jgi:SAM-dependent methyltransferase
VAWHDVECGGYQVDLPLWRELAERAGGPVLEIGAGSGRVALDLAAHGHEVWALDVAPALVEACAQRSRERGLAVSTVCADARTFDLGRRFDLVVAPMQVLQLIERPGDRDAVLERVRAHLAPGGLFAPALADPLEGAAAADALPPRPDTGNRDGWALASTPIAMRDEVAGDGQIRGVAIERIRRATSPLGEVVESAATVHLAVLGSDEVAAAAVACGFRRRPDRLVPETDDYVGSRVVCLEAPAP